MGTIQIKKVERTVTTGKTGETRQKVKKTYGKIIYRGTLNLADMAEHIMKHGTVYTEDVVLGVVTKMKSCMQEMLADVYKVKLDGIGTLYPKVTSKGVAEAKDFSEIADSLMIRNVPIFGVSRDSAQSHRNFIEKQGLKIKLLTDKDHELMEKVGAWGMKKMYGKDVEGVIRSTFIVGKDGTVEAAWHAVKVKGHVESVEQKLKSLLK